MANEVSLDVLYSPSHWSSRLSPDVIVDNHIDVLHKATLRARKLLHCELDIQYDPESKQLLDIYHASDPEQGTSDVLVYIHGGYWQALSKNHSGFIAPLLAKHGITTVALGYDIAPKGSMTSIVDQCRKGCAYVINRFKNSRIFVAGHSAGGHLSACVMTTDWSEYGVTSSHPLTGAVLLSGVYDLKPIQSTYVNRPLNLTQKEVELYSPQCNIDKVPKDIAVLMSHGEEDSPPFKSQGDEYYKSLLEQGVKTSLHIVNEDHFAITERLSSEDPTYSLQQVLVEFLTQK